MFCIAHQSQSELGHFAHIRRRFIDYTGNLAVIFIANCNLGFCFVNLKRFGIESIAIVA